MSSWTKRPIAPCAVDIGKSVLAQRAVSGPYLLSREWSATATGISSGHSASS
jgi:hypothetical protein